MTKGSALTSHRQYVSSLFMRQKAVLSLAVASALPLALSLLILSLSVVDVVIVDIVIAITGSTTMQVWDLYSGLELWIFRPVDSVHITVLAAGTIHGQQVCVLGLLDLPST